MVFCDLFLLIFSLTQTSAKNSKSSQMLDSPVKLSPLAVSGADCGLLKSTFSTPLYSSKYKQREFGIYISLIGLCLNKVSSSNRFSKNHLLNASNL